MFDVDHLGLFILAGLLLNLTPGPDVLYTLSQALRRGRRAGIVAALGIGAGCGVHIVAAAAGLSAVLARSAEAFAMLQWAGAVYLVWAGWRLLRSLGMVDASNSIAPHDCFMDASGSVGLGAVFLQGLATNALNPKVAMFFLAFVPQFIAPGAADPAWAFLWLGLVFNVNGLLVNVGWACAASWLASRNRSWHRGLQWLDRVAGLLFIGFGVRLALAEPPVH